MCILKINIPSGYFFWFVTHESVFIIDLAGRTAALLRLTAIAAYVEFLAILGMRESWVRERTSIRSHGFTIRARETVIQCVCELKLGIIRFIDYINCLKTTYTHTYSYYKLICQIKINFVIYLNYSFVLTCFQMKYEYIKVHIYKKILSLE